MKDFNKRIEELINKTISNLKTPKEVSIPCEWCKKCGRFKVKGERDCICG